MHEGRSCVRAGDKGPIGTERREEDAMRCERGSYEEVEACGEKVKTQRREAEWGEDERREGRGGGRQPKESQEGSVRGAAGCLN